MDTRYRDESFLREQYVERQRSTYEIADECGTADSTVLRWLGKHGISTRPPNPEAEFPSFGTNPTTGYERWRTSIDGTRHEVLVHRLAAVAWFGWDAVVGKEVHHGSNIPWDTRQSNVVPLSKAEHNRRTRSAERKPWVYLDMSAPKDTLTVADLREALDDAPDDAPIAYHAAGYFEYIGIVRHSEPLETDETTIALEPVDVSP